MAAYHEMVDPGASIKSVLGVAPQSSQAATVNGAAIDRAGYMGALVTGLTGTATGSPTTQSTTYKVQDSADGSTGWADYNTSATALTANDGVKEISVDLRGAKKYIRVVAVVAFTGGSTPAQLIGATVGLTGGERLAA